MKVYMISDTHLGVYPLSLYKWMDIQMDYFYKNMIPYIKETVEEGDILIHLGDLFDNRDNVPVITLNKTEELFKELGRILPVYVLVGNHDLWNEGDNSINTPKIFGHMDNVTVYSETHTIELCGKKLVLMPWVEHKVDMIDEIKNNQGDYLFCHSDLNGCRMHLSSIAHNNKDKIDVGEFSGYEKVFSGHIHIKQTNKNFIFIGSPYQMDRNDIGDKKGMTVLDVVSGEVDFVPNDISPEFKKIKLQDDNDFDVLERVDTDKYFVDLEIYNSVLIGTGNLGKRKKLEGILDKKVFSNVDYVNDVVKEKTNEDGLVDVEYDIDVDDIKFDELDNLILRYADELDYDSIEAKEGSMDELKKIIGIYNKEYRFGSE